MLGPRNAEARASKEAKRKGRNPLSSLIPRILPRQTVLLNLTTPQIWTNNGVFSTFMGVSILLQFAGLFALPYLCFVGGYYFGSVDQERYSIQRFARKMNGRVFGKCCASRQAFHSILHSNRHSPLSYTLLSRYCSSYTLSNSNLPSHQLSP